MGSNEPGPLLSECSLKSARQLGLLSVSRIPDSGDYSVLKEGVRQVRSELANTGHTGPQGWGLCRHPGMHGVSSCGKGLGRGHSTLSPAVTWCKAGPAWPHL
jgi:hypothetical protein